MSAAAPAASATERAATGLLSLFYVPRSLVVHTVVHWRRACCCRRQHPFTDAPYSRIFVAFFFTDVELKVPSHMPFFPPILREGDLKSLSSSRNGDVDQDIRNKTDNEMSPRAAATTATTE